MRNLKKILAMVLALVMSLSLMTIAGAEDWPDVEDDNAYATAIEVLSSLNVIRGYEDGTFRPDNELTRAEAAVFVYRVATGDAEDKYKDNYTDMTIPFTDVSDGSGYGWARPYVNYCQNAGIIIGTSATTFSPGNKVTGYQLMVMVLRILGYGKAGEFAAGSADWELKTASRCEELGMLKNIEGTGDFGKPAPRGMVAEILFQGLLQETVTYNASSNGSYTIDGYTKGETLGWMKFKLQKIEGVAVTNEYADIRREDGTLNGVSPTKAGYTILRTATGKEETIGVTSYLEDLGETFIAYTIPEDNIRDTYTALKSVGMEKKYPDGREVLYDDGEKLASISGKTGAMNKDAQTYINFGENTDAPTTTKIKVTYDVQRLVDEVYAANASDAVAAFCKRYYLDPATNSLNILAEQKSVGLYTVTFVPHNVVDNGLIKIDQSATSTEIPAASKRSGGHVYSITRGGQVTSTTTNRNPDGTLAGTTTTTTGNTNWVYRVEIDPGAEYDEFDKAIVENIFNYGSWTGRVEGNTVSPIRAGLVVTGQVYIGTQVINDYSDANNYAAFQANALNVPAQYADPKVSSNELGWWLKIIDNDKDGYADWVFQTRYTVALVTNVDADGKLTLDTWATSGVHATATNDNLNNSSSTNISPISGVINYAGDTIEKGDAVYYAKIDGKYYAWKCGEDYGRVESINRTAKTAVVGGTEYKESAVHEHSTNEDINSGVVNMSSTVELTLYLDKYDNVAAFAQNHDGKLVLLTDGWARTLKNETEYTVRAWDQETQSIEQYDIVSGGNLFIDSYGTNIWDGSSVNSWNRIRVFTDINCGDYNDFAYVGVNPLRGMHVSRHPAGSNNGYYDVQNDTITILTKAEYDATLNPKGIFDDIHTIVAYMDDIDGTGERLIPVDTVYDVKTQNNRAYHMIDMGNSKADIPYNMLKSGVIYNTSALSGIPYNAPQTSAGARVTVPVRALANTTYYFVYNGSQNSVNASGLTVTEKTGYSAASTWMANVDAKYVEDVYVVGKQAKDAYGTYYTAEVVVVELNNQFRTSNVAAQHAFIYNYNYSTVNGIEYVQAILDTGVSQEIGIDLSSSRTYVEAKSRPGGSLTGYGLYKLYPTATDNVYTAVRLTPADIRAAGCYDVGTVVTSHYTRGDDYDVINEWYLYEDPTDADDGKYLNVTNDDDIAAPIVGYQSTALGLLGRGNTPRKNSDTTSYYTLSYSTSGAGTATKSTVDTVLREDYYDTTRGTYNYNYVLVFHVGNSIRYAVSFDSTAYNVWKNVLPDGDKGSKDRATYSDDVALIFNNIPIVNAGVLTLDCPDYDVVREFSASNPIVDLKVLSTTKTLKLTVYVNNLVAYNVSTPGNVVLTANTAAAGWAVTSVVPDVTDTVLHSYTVTLTRP